MKRLFCVFIAIVLLFALCSSVTALDDNQLTIEFESVTGSPGKQVTMKVNVKNNPGIVSNNIIITYDSPLTLVDIKYDVGDYAKSQNISFMAVPYGEGYFPKSSEACINWVSLENLTGDFTIATLTFEISKDATEQKYNISVSYDEENIYNEDEIKVPCIMVEGSIDVKKYTIGDVNNDGVVNAKDRMSLARYLADWTGYEEDKINMDAADVNLDGVVNAKDRMILARHLADWTGYEQLPYTK